MSLRVYYLFTCRDRRLDGPRRNAITTAHRGYDLLKVVGTGVLDCPMLQRYSYRTMRLHLAFLREEGGPLAVDE